MKGADGRLMLIGVSLKMYFAHTRTREWVQEVSGILAAHPAAAGVSAFVIPQYPSIPACVEMGDRLAVGAQDLATEDAGPFTGEVSGAVLAEVGCRYVEVGHAERRRLFGETDDIVAAKVHAALRNGLTPILCVGEEQRSSAEESAQACIRQIESGMRAADAAGIGGAIVVAYEPLWAIGAPAPAGPEHIRSVCARLRAHLADRAVVGGSGGRPGQVIYGGSAGPGLLSEVGGCVDGLFLGRFAHDPSAFRDILDEVGALNG